MATYRQPAGFMVVVALAFALVLELGFCRATFAASEDVAMFYDDLSQYGQWSEYENYGPVWRPNQVSEDWRPYTNGRWVPTDNGYIFESEEPWAWATYHYGNWMPTQGYGWVWVPGRTWYPSTVEWRTSPENTSADESYIGWAPIPPPNYVPTAAYAAPSFSPGNPVVDALTAPFWVFVKAASFLTGLGQPYAPAYSYATTGMLVPPSYVQVFYPQTVIVQRYYMPAYYPPAYLGGHRRVFAAYNWGPPPVYIYRVTRINQNVFTRAMRHNSAYISRIYNVAPPPRVISRYGYLRQIVPPALVQGRPLPPPRHLANYRLAQANLYKPNVLPAPRQVPPVKAQFQKLTPVAGFQPSHTIPPATPPTPAAHPESGRMPSERSASGELHPGPLHAAEPRGPQAHPASTSPGYRTLAPGQPQQERDRQRRHPEALHQPQHLPEGQVRRQQVQQQGQMPPKQQQLEQLRQRQQEQDIQRQRQQEVQRQQLRERQVHQQQHYQRVQQQVRPQPQPAARPQAQVQRRPQPQSQHQQQKQRQRQLEEPHRKPHEPPH